MPVLYQQSSLSPGITQSIAFCLLNKKTILSMFTGGSGVADDMEGSVLPQIVFNVLNSRRGESKVSSEVSKLRQRCSRKNSDELTPVNSVVRNIICYHF